MQGNMKKWASDQISAARKKAMPILSFPSITLMGLTVQQLINSSENQAQGMKKIADRVNSCASVSMMDLSVEAETFGSTIRFSDGEVPTVTGAVVSDQTEADALKIPSVGTGRTGKYIEAIKKAACIITDRPVFAGIIGPFSLAGRLMDVSEALANCIGEPEMVHTVMRKTTDFLIEYGMAYKNAGANGIVMAEPLTGLLSPPLAAEFSSPYVKEIVMALQDDNFIITYHNCGNATIQMIDSILSTGSSAYHFGDAIDMAEMLKHIPENLIVMGNVSPSREFLNGTPESIRKETMRILETCGKHQNFIISSGCDIPPLSSWDNIDSFFNTVDDFYRTH